MAGRVVLAYSGGLDTSVAVRWMREEWGVEVIACAVDVGQLADGEEDVIRERAVAAGAVEVEIIDARDQFARDFLVPALNQLPGVRCFNPQGAFYVYPDIRAFLRNGLKTSDDFAGRLLSEAHVAVTPGSGFGMDGFIRISYAAAYTALEEAVRRLRDFLRAL